MSYSIQHITFFPLSSNFAADQMKKLDSPVVIGVETIPLLLRPLNGLLYQPQMSAEQSVECLAGKTEIFREKQPQCHFSHHKPPNNMP
jgi:hypothetical protein